MVTAAWVIFGLILLGLAIFASRTWDEDTRDHD